MQILNLLQAFFAWYEGCFSRDKTYTWFKAAVLGLLTNDDDHSGVTAIVRSLALPGATYEKLIRFFHSNAYDLQTLNDRWIQFVSAYAPIHVFNDRVLLLGDGVKRSAEGRFMPAVKRLHQESEDSSKGEYIFGHMLGGLGIVIGTNHLVSCPICVTIQDGLKSTATWEGSNHRSEIHEVQTVQNAYHAAQLIGRKSLLALDRLFMKKSVLEELDRLNADGDLLHIVTRTKDRCVAYEPLPPDYKKQGRGAPRKKGETLHVEELFDSRKDDFTTATVIQYNKEVEVQYLCLDLLWGSGLYKKLRFVLTKTPEKGNAIFVTTDLTMPPEKVIEAYAHRFKIESMFRDIKQDFGSFSYRFWTKSTPKLDRFSPSDAPDPLSLVKEEKQRKKILSCLKATETFILCSCMAMGLTQIIATDPAIVEETRESIYMRTYPPKGVASAPSVREYLAKRFFALLEQDPGGSIKRLIRRVRSAHP